MMVDDEGDAANGKREDEAVDQEEKATDNNKNGVEKLYCDVCDVKLAATSAKTHYAGKKHQKLQAAAEHKRELIEKSVFITGFHGKAEEMLVKDIFKADASAISKIVVDRVNGNFAIVEFNSAAVTQKYLKKGRLYFAGPEPGKSTGVFIKQRVIQDWRNDKHEQEKVKKSQLNVTEVLTAAGTKDALQQLNVLVAHTMNEREVARRSAVCSRLTEAFKSILPGDFVVSSFGSSVTRLGMPDSDLDMTIDWRSDEMCAHLDVLPDDEGSGAAARASATDRAAHHLLTSEVADLTGEQAITASELCALNPHDRIKFVTRMVNLLRRKGELPIRDLQPVYAMRCPLLHFQWYDIRTGDDYSCDISLNNRLALNNTCWLAACLHAQPILARLAVLLRVWCEHEGVSCAAAESGRKESHSLNNYSLVLLCIAYLQHKNLLQPFAGTPGVNLISGWNCAFEPAAPQLMPLEVDLLVKGLFEFVYAFGQGGKVVLSCRHSGALVPVEQYVADCKQALLQLGCSGEQADARMKLFTNNDCMLADPFVLNHNTCGRLAKRVAVRLTVVAQKALKRIESPQFAEHGLLALFPARPVAGGSKSGSTAGCVSPSQLETFIKLQPPDSCADAQQWCSTLANGTLDAVLVQVLRFVPDSTGDDDDDELMEPSPAKRPARQSSYTRQYRAPATRTWVGRRTHSKRLAKASPELSALQLECAVTEQVVQSAADHCPPFTFALHVEQPSSGQLDVSVHPVDGDRHEFSVMAHFLTQFLPTLAAKLPV